jgi:hypothetical protein
MDKQYEQSTNLSVVLWQPCSKSASKSNAPGQTSRGKEAKEIQAVVIC